VKEKLSHVTKLTIGYGVPEESYREEVVGERSMEHALELGKADGTRSPTQN